MFVCFYMELVDGLFFKVDDLYVEFCICDGVVKVINGMSFILFECEIFVIFGELGLGKLVIV